MGTPIEFIFFNQENFFNRGFGGWRNWGFKGMYVLEIESYGKLLISTI